MGVPVYIASAASGEFRGAYKGFVWLGLPLSLLYLLCCFILGLYLLMLFFILMEGVSTGTWESPSVNIYVHVSRSIVIPQWLCIFTKKMSFFIWIWCPHLKETFNQQWQIPSKEPSWPAEFIAESVVVASLSAKASFVTTLLSGAKLFTSSLENQLHSFRLQWVKDLNYYFKEVTN